MQRIRIKYKKGDELKFIGHLDLVRLWERALRRTDLPLAYSEGFNPRQKMSFGPPLSLGITSECEFIDIYFERWNSPETVKEELNRTLPKGVEITEARNIFSGTTALTAQITTAKYQATSPDDIQKRIDEITASREIIVKRKDKDVNIRPMIKTLSFVDGKLDITVQCSNTGSVKASEIFGLFPDAKIEGMKRTALS
ncbi:MAG: TIGR03936 family radical SAM-associated protein [Candidatus Saganbacteria bacterium]|nr:TIGR03936 family radical SAM-associated protein [Candidatus Saganbacteria bacterium]